MKTNPKAGGQGVKSGNNSKAPGDIVDLYGWLGIMLDDLRFLMEAVKNRALIESGVSEECFEDLAKACINECTIYCTDGRRKIQHAWPEDSDLKAMTEDETAADQASGKIQDQRQEAKA